MGAQTDLDLSSGKTPREALQALIQTELERHNAIEVTRRALGNLAEKSLRIVETDGSARYEVIDGSGAVRKNASTGTSLTLADLVIELRANHPRLFKAYQHDTAGGAVQLSTPRPANRSTCIPSVYSVRPVSREGTPLAPAPRRPRKARRLTIIFAAIALLSLGLIIGDASFYSSKVLTLQTRQGGLPDGLLARSSKAAVSDAADLKAETPHVNALRTAVEAVASSIEKNEDEVLTRLKQFTTRLDRVQANGAAAPAIAAKLDQLYVRLERIERMSSNFTPPPPTRGPTQVKTPVTTSIPTGGGLKHQRPPIPAAPPMAKWHVYEVVEDTAVLKGPKGLIGASPGDVIPGLGRIQSITRRGGRWVVATSKGVITSR